MKPLGWAALLAAALVFVGGAAYGFTLLTAPADTGVAVATCEPRVIKKGEPVTANLVTVDVYNASRTAGLANRFAVELQRRNFLAGNVANNPTDLDVTDVVILASDRTDPRVKLVKAQFAGKVFVIDQPLPDNDHVQVLIGRNYAEANLKKDAGTAVTSDREISVCLPTVPIE